MPPNLWQSCLAKTHAWETLNPIQIICNFFKSPQRLAKFYWVFTIWNEKSALMDADGHRRKKYFSCPQVQARGYWVPCNHNAAVALPSPALLLNMFALLLSSSPPFLLRFSFSWVPSVFLCQGWGCHQLIPTYIIPFITFHCLLKRSIIPEIFLKCKREKYLVLYCIITYFTDMWVINCQIIW